MARHIPTIFILAIISMASFSKGLLPACAAEPLRVELVAAVFREVGVDFRLTGTLEALDSVDLSFRQGGRITEVLVDEGDSFRKDDILARIDPLQLMQSLKVAEATLAAARAAEEQARRAEERAQAMLKRGVGTRAARDAARQVLSAAETQTRQAETALDQAQRSVDDTQLVAPFDGVVTARSGEPGQVVGATTVVLSLAAKGGVEAVFLTPDMPHLSEAMGKPVELTSIEVDAAPMTARVTEISPLIDAMTGSVRIRALVEDAPNDVALLGAAVRGTLMLSVGHAVGIPWSALNSGAGYPAVWVVGEDGVAKLRRVEIKRFDNDTVLLESGIEVGETVVGNGSQMLYPGRRVIGGESGL
ncbi:MAG: efflux RND transporter periplasmic adaptor subunit [Paracoccus sp. (in: a-proteobacteria)]